MKPTHHILIGAILATCVLTTLYFAILKPPVDTSYQDRQIDSLKTVNAALLIKAANFEQLAALYKDSINIKDKLIAELSKPIPKPPVPVVPDSELPAYFDSIFHAAGTDTVSVNLIAVRGAVRMFSDFTYCEMERGRLTLLAKVQAEGILLRNEVITAQDSAIVALHEVIANDSVQAVLVARDFKERYKKGVLRSFGVGALVGVVVWVLVR